MATEKRFVVCPASTPSFTFSLLPLGCICKAGLMVMANKPSKKTTLGNRKMVAH
ncbi:hypothetical protein EV356DRAFT_495877 [Viridothelium virens]|uniref:Uncharacterized protein n=1 Tax=Viridothelium virens TaxID=1048519 RepID=A0A6A6HQ85_VIRVR|nr:hypothetical protein EV356DRAFT_495877 [Viridothelium virens]